MKVFLSYSTLDHDAARRLKDALERARPGVEIFFAPQSLVAGDVWQARLADNLAEADVLLLLLGRKLGPWQERECQEAQRLQLLAGRDGRPRIVPVALGGDAVLPGFVGLLHTITAPQPDHDDSIAAIVSTLDRAPAGAASPDWSRVNPYKGLASLAPSDAPFFFGREAKTAEVLDRIREQPNKVLVLVGNSGVGKSSLMQAGVIDALRTQRWPGAAAHEAERWTAGLADSHRWTSLSFRPGEEPLQALALAFVALTERSGADRDEESGKWVKRFLDGAPLHRLAAYTIERLAETGNEPPKRFLIYVDQGEELYARAATAQRAPFSALLAEAAARPEFVVLMSLRADYYGRLQEDAALFNASLRLDLPPMTSEELAQAIGRPATRLGVRFETDDAPERLANAVADHPGALPLLSDLLADLWRDMRGRNDAMLRWSHRMELVDVSATLRQRADKFLADDPAREASTRRLFTLRLAHAPPQGEPVRRRARRSECDDAEWAIAELLAGQEWRLLSLGVDPATSESTAEVAHEQLLRSWPTLKQWLDDAREFLVWKGTLEQDRRDWEEAGKPDAALLLGQRLVRARYWMGERERDIPVDDLVYVDASEAHDRIERKAKQRAEEQRLHAEAERQKAEAARLANNKRWLRAGAIGVGVATLIVAGFAALLFDLRSDLRTQSRMVAEQTQRAVDQEKRAGDAERRAVVQERRAQDQERQAREQERRAITEEGRAQDQQSLALALLGQERLRAGHAVAALQLALEGLPTVVDRPWNSHAAGLMIAALGQQRERLVLRSHRDEVRGVAFSADGTRVMSVSSDGTVRAWQVSDGRELTVLRGLGDGLTNAIFSPDGRQILTTSRNGTARLWEADTGRSVVTLTHGRGWVTGAAFSADGRRILTASWDGTARLWDADSGRSLTTLRDLGIIVSVAISPDGTRAIFGSANQSIEIWDIQSANRVAALVGHTRAVLSFAMSPDGTLVATASADETARIWEAVSGRQLAVLRGHHGGVSRLAFSADGKSIATAGSDGTARLWDVVSGREIMRLAGHDESATSVAISRDGTVVATSSRDGTVRLWNATDERQAATLRGHESGLTGALFSADGTRILTMSADRTARLWDTASGGQLAALQHSDMVLGAAFSIDDTRLATTAVRGQSRLWHADGREIATLSEHEAGLNFVAFSPDGRFVATAAPDNEVWLSDAKTGKLVLPLRGHRHVVSSGAFSPDSERLVTASIDGTVRLWTVTGQTLAELRGHQSAVLDMRFSPDGKRVATASGDNTARLWDAVTGRELAVLRGHSNSVNSVTFSADGLRVLTASQDKTARVWDASDGKEITVLAGHGGPVYRAEFSADGTRALTASADSTARLWETVRGRQLAILPGHDRDVITAVFSPDGKRILTASGDGTARLWIHVQSMRELIQQACASLQRPMSREERRRYLLEEDPKAPACGWHPDMTEKPAYALPRHLR